MARERSDYSVQVQYFLNNINLWVMHLWIWNLQLRRVYWNLSRQAYKNNAKVGALLMMGSSIFTRNYSHYFTISKISVFRYVRFHANIGPHEPYYLYDVTIFLLLILLLMIFPYLLMVSLFVNIHFDFAFLAATHVGILLFFPIWKRLPGHSSFCSLLLGHNWIFSKYDFLK